jgi:hypothetical protein
MTKLKTYKKMLEYHTNNGGGKTTINRLKADIDWLETQELMIKREKKIYYKLFIRKPMNHAKILEHEATHKVVTVETEKEETVLFEGTKRECQGYIDRQGLITLEIKPIKGGDE